MPCSDQVFFLSFLEKTPGKKREPKWQVESISVFKSSWNLEFNSWFSLMSQFEMYSTCTFIEIKKKKRTIYSLYWGLLSARGHIQLAAVDSLLFAFGDDWKILPGAVRKKICLLFRFRFTSRAYGVYLGKFKILESSLNYSSYFFGGTFFFRGLNVRRVQL